MAVDAIIRVRVPMRRVVVGMGSGRRNMPRIAPANVWYRGRVALLVVPLALTLRTRADRMASAILAVLEDAHVPLSIDRSRGIVNSIGQARINSLLPTVPALVLHQLSPERIRLSGTLRIDAGDVVTGSVQHIRKLTHIRCIADGHSMSVMDHHLGILRDEELTRRCCHSDHRGDTGREGIDDDRGLPLPQGVVDGNSIKHLSARRADMNLKRTLDLCQVPDHVLSGNTEVPDLVVDVQLGRATVDLVPDPVPVIVARLLQGVHLPGRSPWSLPTHTSSLFPLPFRWPLLALLLSNISRMIFARSI